MSAAQSRHKRWISYDQSEQYELQAGKLELNNQLSAEKVARKAAEKHATHESKETSGAQDQPSQAFQHGCPVVCSLV